MTDDSGNTNARTSRRCGRTTRPSNRPTNSRTSSVAMGCWTRFATRSNGRIDSAKSTSIWTSLHGCWSASTSKMTDTHISVSLDPQNRADDHSGRFAGLDACEWRRQLSRDSDSHTNKCLYPVR